MFFPGDKSIGVESDFPDFGIGRSGSVAAKIDFINAKDIGGTEERADVEEASDILGDEVELFHGIKASGSKYNLEPTKVVVRN